MKAKKTEIINGIGKDPRDHIVQKSNPLIDMVRSEFTLAQFKLLDAYLARIDSHDPDKRTVSLDKHELEEYLGVTKISSKDIQDRIADFSKGIRVDNQDEPGEFDTVYLFERISYKRDNNGVWVLTMTCTEPAKKYFFNVERLGYLRYKLRSVLGIRSKFSYCLFIYLESNRRMHLSWSVSVDELREATQATAASYDGFRYLHRALDAAREELEKNTECRFSFTTTRRGRKISEVRFKLQPIKEEQTPEFIEDPFPADFAKMSEHDKEYWMMKEILGDLFNDKEITLLHDYLEDVPLWNLPKHAAAIPTDIYLRRYHYIQEVRHRYEAAKTRKDIKNPFFYISKIMMNDTERGEDS